MLAARSDGVAHHSLHMDGLALDWRVPGRTARSTASGGARDARRRRRLLSQSDFVHTDVGRVRYW